MQLLKEFLSLIFRKHDETIIKMEKMKINLERSRSRAEQAEAKVMALEARLKNMADVMANKVSL